MFYRFSLYLFFKNVENKWMDATSQFINESIYQSINLLIYIWNLNRNVKCAELHVHRLVTFQFSCVSCVCEAIDWLIDWYKDMVCKQSSWCDNDTENVAKRLRIARIGFSCFLDHISRRVSRVTWSPRCATACLALSRVKSGGFSFCGLSNWQKKRWSKKWAKTWWQVCGLWSKMCAVCVCLTHT